MASWCLSWSWKCSHHVQKCLPTPTKQPIILFLPTFHMYVNVGNDGCRTRSTKMLIMHILSCSRTDGHIYKCPRGATTEMVVEPSEGSIWEEFHCGSDPADSTPVEPTARMWMKASKGKRDVLCILQFRAYFVAKDFVPVDLPSRDRKLPPESLECSFRHRLVVLGNGRLKARFKIQDSKNFIVRLKTY